MRAIFCVLGVAMMFSHNDTISIAGAAIFCFALFGGTVKEKSAG